MEGDLFNKLNDFCHTQEVLRRDYVRKLREEYDARVLANKEFEAKNDKEQRELLEKINDSMKPVFGIGFGFEFVDELPPVRCSYFYHEQRKQCKRFAIPGSDLCLICSVTEQRKESQPKLPYGRPLRLNACFYRALNANENNSERYYLSKEEVAAYESKCEDPPEAIIISSEGKRFYVHKALLTAIGPYYREVFVDTNVFETNMSTNTLRNYLDLLYGRTVFFADWREAFDVFDAFCVTLERFGIPEKAPITTAFQVDKKDYGEYIVRLCNIYNNKIPPAVIERTKRFLD